MKKPNLSPIEMKILKVLLERKSFLTTSEVAKKSKISWNTAHIYLNRFYGRKWIARTKRGNRLYWRAYR